jgi:DNA-binding NtrC family response regulator
MLQEHHIDLVITDLKMPIMDGMGLLRRALRLEPELPIVMITAHGTVDNAVEALKTGAFDYITKPFDQAEVRAIVRKALDTRRLSSHEAHARPEFGLVGQSEAVRTLNEQLGRLAETTAPLLIVGESGTGKELVARSVHERSAGLDRPFVKVNCAAIAAESMAGELFGTVRSPGGKPGRLELAAGGTLFLDEIGAVPRSVLERLVTAVSHGHFEREGGVGQVPFDARLIAAARGEASGTGEEQNAAENLATLLSGVVVSLPPLRDRAEDVLPICADIIARLNARFGKQLTTVSPAAAEQLQRYPWPGNIRELENVLEQAVLLSEGDVVELTDLPAELSVARASERATPAGRDPGLRAQVKAITSRVERQLIQKALQQTNGNVTHAARLLKISRKGLQLKMKELGLRERDE